MSVRISKYLKLYVKQNTHFLPTSVWQESFSTLPCRLGKTWALEGAGWVEGHNTGTQMILVVLSASVRAPRSASVNEPCLLIKSYSGKVC